jgi:HlyD family secretion protein
MSAFELDLAVTQASMRRLIRVFSITIIVLVFGVGGWAVASRIESAVIANGNFVVQSNGQAVQHLKGGIVGEILVAEGDRVKKGQVVMRLDAAQVHAQLGIVRRQIIDFSAERARLIAERDLQPTLRRPRIVNGNEKDAQAMHAAITLQQTLLTARLSAFESQMQQLNEQKTQTNSAIEGLVGLQQARKDELEQLDGDLDAFNRLDKKRLVRRSVLRQARRQVSRARGDILDIASRLATKRSKLSEIEFRIREATRKRRSEILDKLQEIESNLATAYEKYHAAKDQMTRLDIRAPSAGIVHELKAHTVGGVIKPGEAVMTIVPNDDPLLVVARIRPGEVDQVAAGQKAAVRISAFKRQKSPELDGEVINVAADRSLDERSGQTFFEVKIKVLPGQEEKLGDKKLTAGLPAEVFIKGEPRRVITYLTQPLTDQIGLAFREE